MKDTARMRTMPYLNKSPPNPEPLDCRILNAALDLFVLKGYHNVSVHDVQRESDVSIGSIYKYFGGKEGIAKALYDRLLAELDEMLDNIIHQYHHPKDRCEAIIRQLFEYTETHPHIIAYIFHAKHVEFISDESPLCNTRPFSKMHDIVQEGIKKGQFRKINPRVATANVFGGAIRLIHLRLDKVIEEPLTLYLNETLENIWHGMETSSDTGAKPPP